MLALMVASTFWIPCFYLLKIFKKFKFNLFIESFIIAAQTFLFCFICGHLIKAIVQTQSEN